MANPNNSIDELNALKDERQVLQSRQNTAKPQAAAVTEPSADMADEQPGNTDNVARHLATNLESVVTDVKNVAREYPVVSLLASFGIGVIVGRFFSRR